ncbi:hypothetical protein Rhopal_004086-T1 [Rhodotorula paludigena]|uniref:Uncharacterized protein n=1 Tax=Rhodotorula paludigena TaxID=86838 RepID=A0AAV5GF67_9BASI|nr:hypothetical protein Rhopal_004086-T1 [Rhodotorula paludigena]
MRELMKSADPSQRVERSAGALQNVLGLLWNVCVLHRRAPPALAGSYASSSSSSASDSGDTVASTSTAATSPSESPDRKRKSPVPARASASNVVPQTSTDAAAEAIAAIRARPGPSEQAKDVQPLLYLPPLLSRLPPSAPAPSPAPSASLSESTTAELAVHYTNSHLPHIDPVSLALHRALHVFRPVTPYYATTPYAAAFNWDEVVLEDDASGSVRAAEREYYVVAFRSLRKRGLPDKAAQRLYEADRAAHEEAVTNGSLLIYWYGAPLTADTVEELSGSADDIGRNLATCIWTSRAAAVGAMRGEHHRVAAKLASEAYESYTLERYILRKEPGELTITVQPWHGREVAGAT